MAVGARDVKICYSIVKFLQSHIDRDAVSEERKESLEIAISCLKEAYGFQMDDADDRRHGLPVTLEELFDQVSSVNSLDSEAKFREAERLKNEGNTKLKLNDLQGAIELYTEAIELDPSNATYYSNRAAAYIKQNELHKALADCNKATFLKPDYAKAYGRLGTVYNLLNQSDSAREAFEKAVELDPDNADYRSNLEMLQQPQNSSNGQRQATETSGPGVNPPSGPGMGPPPGGPGMGPPPGMNFPPGFDMSNISGLMSNPAFMNLASTVMSNPVFQGMATSFLQNMGGGGGGGGATASGAEGTGSRPFNVAEMIPQMSQMAQEMQQSDPAGYENLRQTAAQFQAQHNDSHS